MDLNVKLKIMKVLEENVGSQVPFFPFFWSEGSIFFQTPLLACPGCPESVASWLGLAFLVWGRENKKRKKLGILRGPSSQSSGQRERASPRAFSFYTCCAVIEFRLPESLRWGIWNRKSQDICCHLDWSSGFDFPPRYACYYLLISPKMLALYILSKDLYYNLSDTVECSYLISVELEPLILPSSFFFFF